MSLTDALRASDAVAVARYLQVRALFHDRHLPRVEQLIQARYMVAPASRPLPATLVCDLRNGFMRPGEGDLWPVVFLTTVDISLALCVELSAERVASLGTTVNGPQRIRHRGWEDWWGWERPLGQIRSDFYELPLTLQDEAIVGWYAEHLEWLVSGGLLRRKT
jgi:hypothetical protein